MDTLTISKDQGLVGKDKSRELFLDSVSIMRIHGKNIQIFLGGMTLVKTRVMILPLVYLLYLFQ